MERTQAHTPMTRIERHLAQLKVISRLVGHELRAQTGPRVTLSRDEVLEIQTGIDLFIEQFSKKRAGASTTVSPELEVQAVSARIN